MNVIGQKNSVQNRWGFQLFFQTDLRKSNELLLRSSRWLFSIRNMEVMNIKTMIVAWIDPLSGFSSNASLENIVM